MSFNFDFAQFQFQLQIFDSTTAAISFLEDMLANVDIYTAAEGRNVIIAQIT